ncbi:MAG: ABC transporter ATP-binding protein [Pseudomonadota bacterium]
MADLIAENVSIEIGDAAVVDGASLPLARGELICLLGPNGAGKTSLIRAMIGQLSPTTGRVLLDGEAVSEMPADALARRIAYLPQIRPLAWPMRARDVVALGRFAYGASPSRLGAEDAAAVERALSICGLSELAHRRVDTLSGGEAARVHVARALASSADFLIADEPVAALDPRRQHEVMALIRAFAKAGGGAICVLHDAALAARYADRLAFMRHGRLLAVGPPAETLTPARFAEVYDLTAEITSPADGAGATIRIIDIPDAPRNEAAPPITPS